MTIKNLAAAAFAAAALITVPASLGTSPAGAAPASSITADAATDRIAQGFDVDALQTNFFVADGLVYHKDPESNIVSLAGRWTNATIIDMPDMVNYHGKTYEITAVRNDAFNRVNPNGNDRYYVRSFKAGRYVKSIGDRAFKDCYLKDINLNTGLETIGADAFNGTALTEVVIPYTTAVIGDRAFANTSLQEIFFDYAAAGPEYLKLQANAFSNNEQLHRILNYRRFWTGPDGQEIKNKVIENAFTRQTPYVLDEYGFGFVVGGWYRDVLERVIFK